MNRFYWLPIYWPFWMAIGLFRLLILLPYAAQLSLGKKLGQFILKCAKRSRHIARINLKLCFPNLNKAERDALLKENFENMGMALFETAMGFWGSDRRLKPLGRIIGGEYLDAALKSGKGILLLGAHFTTLEIIGRACTFDYQFSVMYRQNKIGIVDFIIERALKKHYTHAVPRQNVREMVRLLKAGNMIWYSGDVNAGRKASVFAPFFNIPAATVKAASWFAEKSGCVVMPVTHYRRADNTGYDIVVSPPLENFPSDSLEKDAAKVNQVIEQAVRQTPAQYLWSYMRFKTRPEGEPRLYGKSSPVAAALREEDNL